MKKYRLIDDVYDGVSNFGSLYRVEALIDFADVKAGDIGGFVASEDNLSHEGNAWVYDDAMVLDEAFVKDNARVRQNAVVLDGAIIAENAVVSGWARIGEHALILENAVVTGDARLFNVVLTKDAYVSSSTDCFTVDPIGLMDGALTFYKNKGDDILTVGSEFFGIVPIDKLAKLVNEKYGDHEYKRVYELAIELAKLQIRGGGLKVK